MKKRILTLALALALCLGLAAPASAYNMGKAGENNVISAGSAHSGFIDKNGSLWMWGNNDFNQLGNGTTKKSTTPVKVMDNVAAVSCGGSHTAALKTDGTLWTWGYNWYGQLGNGTTKKSTPPVKVMDNVAAVSCGGSHTAAVKTDGTLWTWGDNPSGQLGNGTATDSATPVKVLDNVAAVSCGNSHTAAIKTDGTLWTWGRNDYGQLGNGTRKYSTTPVKVLDNAAAVSCGRDHTAAVKTDGTLWTWGSNTSGRLGNGGGGNSKNEFGGTLQTTPVKVLDNVAAVSCGSSHTAAVKTDGALLAWGSNGEGQLGNGSTTDANKPVTIMYDAAAVSCGQSHTAAVKTDGTIWTWGWNGRGELGNGGEGNSKTEYGTTFQTIPQKISLTGPIGVKLSLNGGIGVNLLWCDKNGQVSPPSNPTRPGYNFAGWYTDAALTKPWNFNDKVVNTLVLYARWLPVSSSSETTEHRTQIIRLNGNTVTLDAYNLIADSNGGDTTYVRLRDIAALLDGTGSQFDVDWRNKTIYVDTGKPYTHRAGTELQPLRGSDGRYRWNTAPILFNGVTAPLEGIVITDSSGGGNTFFKLRDLGAAVGFTVGWTPELGIYIETK